MFFQTGVVFVVTESLNNYFNVKASIRIRTDYLNFSVYYPAIFICEKREMEGKMAHTLQRYHSVLTYITKSYNGRIKS